MTVTPRTSGLLGRPVYDGLEKGRLGVVAAPAGVGKSTFLVRLALGELVRGSQVLHVALDHPVGHVRAAYDTKLEALRARDPEGTPAELRFEVERLRMIHSFLRGTFSPAKLDEAVGFLEAHVDFRPETIVVDPFPFEERTAEEVSALAEVARRVGARIWLSALVARPVRGEPEDALPEPLGPFTDLLDVVIRLRPSCDAVQIDVLKERGLVQPRRLPFALDPATMLLV